MESTPGNIYDFPAYYDLVYGSDWRAEFGFLEDVFETHVDHVVGNVFEPACGTGRLLFRFARAGYHVGGNDLNQAAIEYCNKRLQRIDSPGRTVVEDMTDFRLPRPVDAAFNTINSFRHLSTARQAEDHLVCMREAIRPGGVYVLGLHLSPLEGEPTESESWSASRGHLTVNSSMWLVERNLPERYERFGMTFDVYTPTKSFQIRDEVSFRTYSARQITALVGKVAGFEIEAAYDFHYEISTPVEMDSATEDIVLILKRT